MFLLAWILFYTLHSVLLAPAVAAAATRWIFKKRHHYRLFYAVFGVALFTWAARLTQHSGSAIQLPSWTTWLAALPLLAGVFIILQAFKAYRLRVFLGLSAEPSPALHTTGMNALVRHPLYLGTVLVFASCYLLLPTTAWWMALTTGLVYLPLGIWLEEKKLVALHGEAYRQYQQKVPPLFPKIFRHAG